MWNNQSMNTLSLSNLHERVIPLPSWEKQLDIFLNDLLPLFPRKEVREQARNYLQGLLAPVERKNGWQLAEHLGQLNPYRLQHLLDRAVWDADLITQQLGRFVLKHLGAPEGVAVLDETGFLKKGEHSCGVKRQYTGTAGRVENCQVGVFLSYASHHGQALLDRELYLPKEWADDKERRDKAKVPEEVKFATKPQLALKMLERAYLLGLPISWVTADSVYGGDPALRQSLEEKYQPYVLAVAKDERLLWEEGQIRAETLARRLPASTWQTLSCGAGAKGERLYDWGLLPLDAPSQEGFSYWLLVRRSLSDSTECAYYLVFAPKETSLSTMIGVAGTRWTIEVGFENAKGEVGLDHYEVRSWHGWYRHMSLALWAQALLVVLRKQQIQSTQKKGDSNPRNCLRIFKQSRGLWCP
jgi:SRSO17 transposase